MPTTQTPFRLRVRAAKMVATDVRAFELAPVEGASLPQWQPGAHINVVALSGHTRSYSLCNDPSDASHYRIAVKREARGRGGSRAMVDVLQVGEMIEASLPVNNFCLHTDASAALLIAGGIGITPLLAMAYALRDRGTPFRLIVLTRDPDTTPFHEALHTQFAPQLTLHHDGGEASNAFDLWPLLEKPTKTQVYCCGPRGLMESVRDMSGHWPSKQIHFESFGVSAEQRSADTAFEVELAHSARTVEVSAQQSLLEALRAAGIEMSSSCEAGSCGACKTLLLTGIAEHRDFVLMPDEHERFIMPCVSRAAPGQRLVLAR